MWFVKEQCIDQKALNYVDHNAESAEMINNFVNSCCSKNALISCHFKDKPSAVNCNSSPSIDIGGKAFWEER